MFCDTQITYINKSINRDVPKIFIFASNAIPSFDALKEGVAWKVIENIGQDSMSCFVYPAKTEVYASWENNCNQTKALNCIPGKRYTITENSSGIILIENGNALKSSEVELTNDIKVKNGISAHLSKGGSDLIKKNVVAFGQKASFLIKPKIYWGIASEIQQSGAISSAVIDSLNFFEQNLESVSSATVSLNGNAKEGYSFKVEEQE
ncbi:hypothetical protein [Pseudoalteromonas tunicata]|jgi:hypothetical protein|uniref:Uncharacterized protein n=1 Tax=Pseudoalteromonas tunicata D2 TaxID=87626 RepID=A4CA67_9GAMM|nr:hypothetical protein [Pseudoalteromonas tunicata]ATC94825.1 hypothetical protein PTUN_a2328 [Pseudoalteromonas tunicata]AXT30516.1 hypothetical protein D1819_06560 [Pseudoalteromonas tunicata]EAR28275.1 hypothetical protein PTD2_20707 [Pseudoalteromonas tunicata D2]